MANRLRKMSENRRQIFLTHTVDTLMQPTCVSAEIINLTSVHRNSFCQMAPNGLATKERSTLRSSKQQKTDM